MPKRIGLYGGSFNPIHLGHLIVARAVAEIAGLDRLIFLPSRTPPHKTHHQLLDAEHRAAMVRLAITDEPLFEFSDFDLTRIGPTYTIDTVRHFRPIFDAGTELFWLIGGDSLRELVTWKQLADLVSTCTVLTATRAGFAQVDWSSFRSFIGDDGITRLQNGMLMTPVVEISSTDIRRRIRDRRSIRFLVTENVRAYIETRRIYLD